MPKDRALKETILDVVARKLTGWIGRFIYGRLAALESPDRQVADALDLRSDDDFFEIGPGAGHLLKTVLEKVRSVAAIDASEDMVAPARISVWL